MCGEKRLLPFSLSVLPGSPPRVRGKVLDDFKAHPDIRITPACAGKRQGRKKIRPKAEDHPRVCGEKWFSLSLLPFRLGSPPRVRGKVPLFFVWVLGERITPACAGKSIGFLGADAAGEDHPRVCGEKCRPARCRAFQRGSPPRVRGKGASIIPLFFVWGITPACAGKR